MTNPSPSEEKESLLDTVTEAFRDNQDIRAKAHSLTRGYFNERDKAQRLHQWVHNNITYDLQKYDGRSYYRTAQEVFHERKGICLDMAILYSTMGRAIGLNVGCTWNGKDHAYASLSLHGEKILVDPTREDGFDIHYPINYDKKDSYWDEEVTFSKYARGKSRRMNLYFAAALFGFTIGTVHHYSQKHPDIPKKLEQLLKR